MMISNIKVQISDKYTIAALTMKPGESQYVVVRWARSRGNQAMRVKVDAASVHPVTPVNMVHRGRATCLVQQSFSVGAAT